MQKFNVQKFHTFYAKMMIFFNGDGFKLGRLEKRVPNLLHTLFMKVHEIYFKEYHCKVERVKLDLKNALLSKILYLVSRLPVSARTSFSFIRLNR